MGSKRMDVTLFVGKLLEEDDVDLLREGVRVPGAGSDGVGGLEQIDAAPYERRSYMPRSDFLSSCSGTPDRQ